jgi:hypothetical protein
MELLFKRNQSSGRVGRVAFKLWAKLELDGNEQVLVERYRFDEALLIQAEQPKLLRNAILMAVLVWVLLVGALGAFLGGVAPTPVRSFVAVVVAIVAGYAYFHNKRESIYVRDLLHGRYFSCGSVIELARKEAWLQTIVAFLRQVMESAKHWDGTERHTIEPLPKEEARQVILKGI